MKKRIKTYLVLALVLILFLLPIMQVLAQIEALKGGKAGLVVLLCFIVFSIVYWIVMLYLTKKKGGRK